MSESLTLMAWWGLPKEDQPPEDIWGLDDELEQWWQEVELRRKEKYGSKEKHGSDGGGQEPMTEVPMDQNEYAKALLAGTAK